MCKDNTYNDLASLVLRHHPVLTVAPRSILSCFSFFFVTITLYSLLFIFTPSNGPLTGLTFQLASKKFSELRIDKSQALLFAQYNTIGLSSNYSTVNSSRLALTVIIATPWSSCNGRGVSWVHQPRVRRVCTKFIARNGPDRRRLGPSQSKLIPLFFKIFPFYVFPTAR